MTDRRLPVRSAGISRRLAAGSPRYQRFLARILGGHAHVRAMLRTRIGDGYHARTEAISLLRHLDGHDRANGDLMRERLITPAVLRRMAGRSSG